MLHRGHLLLHRRYAGFFCSLGGKILQLIGIVGKIEELKAIDFRVPDEFPAPIANHSLDVSVSAE